MKITKKVTFWVRGNEFCHFGNEFHRFGNEFSHFGGNEFRPKRTKKPVYGSNESLQHADKELGPYLRIGSPLQRISQKVDVCAFCWCKNKLKI